MAGASSDAIDRFYAQQAQPDLAQLAQIATAGMPVVGPAVQAAVNAPAALEALALPGNAVRSTLGAGAKMLPGGGQLPADNQAAFDEVMYRGLTAPGMATPGTPLGAIAGLSEPIAKFMQAQLFDPINFVGAGIPGSALKAGKLAKAGLSADDLASAAQGLGKTPDELLKAFASPPDRMTRNLEMLDAFEGQTQEALLSVFKMIPKAAGKVGEAIPFHREIIGDVGADLTANVRQSENLTDYATALSKQGYLKKFAGGLQDAVSQYKHLGGDFSEIDPSILPDDLAGIFTDGVKGGFGQHVRTLGTERDKLEKLFGDIWASRKGVSEFDPAVSAGGTNSLEKLTAVLDDLGVPHGGIESSVDLLKAAQTHIADRDWNTFDQIVKSYPAGDVLKDNPMDLVLDRVVRDRAKMLGIEEPTGFSKAWQTGTALFNEQALQSISYLLTNALGGTAMGALEGVNPLKVGRNLVDNFGSAARGEPVFTSSTRDLTAALGLMDENGKPLLPRTVSAEGAGMLNEANPSRLYTGTGLTASQAIGTPALATGGAILGGASGFASSPDDASFSETATNTLAGAAGGGVAGGMMPTLSKYLLQRMSRGIEDVLRQSAWELGTRRGVAQAAPDLEEIIKTAYTNGFQAPPATVDVASTNTSDLVNLLRQQGVEPPKIGVSMDQWGIHEQPDWGMLEGIRSGTATIPEGPAQVWADAFAGLTPQAPTPNLAMNEVLKAVSEVEGLFSPETLRNLLKHQVGASDDAVDEAGKAWQNVIHRASTQGADLSNTINFDYANLNNLEQMVKQVVPFSTWSMKAMPFFARHIAEHPAILTSALELRRQSSNMRDEQGLTGRVQGSVPYGEPMDALWSVLLGRDVDTYSNPLRGLVPFSDTFKSLDDLDQIDNPIAKAYKLMTALGPSAHPAIEFMARTAGLLGTDTPAKGLSRTAGPIQGATGLLGLNRGRGVNSEAALTEGEGRLREALSGDEVTDLTTVAAERRMDELALKTTGKTITSGDPVVAPYLQQKSAQKGKLWDQAMKDVSRERGVRSLVGYVSNQASPTAIVSREEAGIRGARAGLLVDQELSNRVRELNSTNPMHPVGRADLAAVEEILAQLPPESGISQEHIQVVRDQPVAANVNWLFRAIYEYQQEADPTVSAYSGSGSPEQRDLQAKLGEYKNLAAAIPELQNLPPEEIRAIEALTEPSRRSRGPGNKATDALAAKISQRRNQFRGANPQLDAYLSWLAQRQGKGSPEEFVAEQGRR